MSETETKDETCYKIDEDKPETCPGNCRTHGKAVEHIPTRAEKRRLKREIEKQLNPPKYGPVVIYTESHKLVDGKLQKGYLLRTNIQDLEEFDRVHAKRDEDYKGKR